MPTPEPVTKISLTETTISSPEDLALGEVYEEGSDTKGTTTTTTVTVTVTVTVVKSLKDLGDDPKMQEIRRLLSELD
ncbi:MAG: hypothetical protein O9304_06490 [Microcystis sp. LE19-114.1B]|jgi:hypothetical protein|nr:hypothetical protein [Microcystis sp. LE19-114.1B]